MPKNATSPSRKKRNRGLFIYIYIEEFSIFLFLASLLCPVCPLSRGIYGRCQAVYESQKIIQRTETFNNINEKYHFVCLCVCVFVACVYGKDAPNFFIYCGSNAFFGELAFIRVCFAAESREKKTQEQRYIFNK